MIKSLLKARKMLKLNRKEKNIYVQNQSVRCYKWRGNSCRNV